MREVGRYEPLEQLVSNNPPDHIGVDLAIATSEGRHKGLEPPLPDEGKLTDLSPPAPESCCEALESPLPLSDGGQLIEVRVGEAGV